MNPEEAELIKLLLSAGPLLMHKVISDYQPPKVGFKLNRTQWKALFILNGRDNSNMSQLSKFMNMEKGSVTSVVDGLIEKGMLVRIQDENDRRKICLELTDRSKPIVQKGIKLMVDHLMLKLDKLSEAEKKQLHDSLKFIMQIAERL